MEEKTDILHIRISNTNNKCYRMGGILYVSFKNNSNRIYRF